MPKKMVLIRWLGDDSVSMEYGPLLKGRELEVPVEVAAPWLRAGDAEEVGQPRTKKTSKED